MPTIYREELLGLRSALCSYRAAQLGMEELKAHIWRVSQVVSSHEERSLRETLQACESEIDSMQFTVDSAEVFARTLSVIGEIERVLDEALRT